MKSLLAPLIAGLAVAAISWWLGWGPHLADESAVLAFAGTISSIASTMLGFMLAALAVIASISNTDLLQKMRKTGHYDDLLNTVFAGCFVFLVVALCGFAMLFGVSPSRAFLSAILALHGAAFVSLIDIGRKFRLVLVNLE